MTKFNGKILLTEDITRKVNKVAIKEWGGWENQKMLHRLEIVAQEAAEIAITEYDKIARQEERERCIRIALNAVCNECVCNFNGRCKKPKVDNHDTSCQKLARVLKELEGSDKQ